jgi:hypothetical protein
MFGYRSGAGRASGSAGQQRHILSSFYRLNRLVDFNR